MGKWYVDWSNELHNVLGNGGLGLSKITQDLPEYAVDVRSGDLIFLHTDNYDGWRQYAEDNQSIYIIFISRAAPGGGLPDENELPNNCHLCLYPASSLNTNIRVQEFLDNGNNSMVDRDWTLLQPEPYPEYLVASYLLDVALTMPGHDTFKEVLKSKSADIWNVIKEKAKTEFLERGGNENDWTQRRVAAVRNIFSRIGG